MDLSDIPFVPGVTLAEHLFEQGVRPILDRRFPGVPYSAGLFGSGSEVLGLDTPRSRDHHWGPRLMVFLTRGDLDRLGHELDRTLASELPLSIDGYPTHFGPAQVDGSRHMIPVETGPVDHRVELHAFAEFLDEYLGVADPEWMTALDWLVVPQQKLRTIAEGALFHDGLGELGPARAKLRWYPESVWRALLAAQWGRIGQEEPFPGRAAEAGDDLGSRIVAARLVRDVMRLCFLMERTYAPYSKWFGTAFARLSCAAVLAPSLTACLDAWTWEHREDALVEVFRSIARMHNALELTELLPVEPTPFWSRPFRVIHGERFADALASGLDDGLLRLASQIGSIDTWVDSTDVLSSVVRARRTKGMYDE